MPYHGTPLPPHTRAVLQSIARQSNVRLTPGVSFVFNVGMVEHGKHQRRHTLHIDLEAYSAFSEGELPTEYLVGTVDEGEIKRLIGLGSLRLAAPHALSPVLMSFLRRQTDEDLAGLGFDFFRPSPHAIVKTGPKNPHRSPINTAEAAVLRRYASVIPAT